MARVGTRLDSLQAEPLRWRILAVIVRVQVINFVNTRRGEDEILRRRSKEASGAIYQRSITSLGKSFADKFRCAACIWTHHASANALISAEAVGHEVV
ncbi:MAG: hypothetical protein ABSB99_08345 [Acidimicrobiales bacterium]|jgi:hypothetical protein